MTPQHKMRVNAAAAALAGLALRIVFILRFPMGDSGDAPVYIALAHNWLRAHVYGLAAGGAIQPADLRVPGYPAFLAAIFAVFGESTRAAMLVQALLDLGTCFLAAALAIRLAAGGSRRAASRAALAALWLAALCPFTANYTAVLETETLAILLTTLALLLLASAGAKPISEPATGRSRLANAIGDGYFLAGVVSGLGALVRPETPLVLGAAGLVLMWRWRRPADWRHLFRAGLLMGMGLALPLLPWAGRNWRALHEIQFLSPRYSQMPGETAPRGFDAWTGTWLWRMRDVYTVSWKLDVEPISLGDIPGSAADSAAERRNLAQILDRYNDTLTLDPAMDAAFGQLARERTARRPLRTYIEVPFLRSLAMWFSPRIELLPVSGTLFPLAREWDEDRADLLVTLGAIVLNAEFIALALAGLLRAMGPLTRRRPRGRLVSGGTDAEHHAAPVIDRRYRAGATGLALLVVFVLLRTVFFAYFAETAEPRYVLECFPALLAFAAQIFGSQ